MKSSLHSFLSHIDYSWVHANNIILLKKSIEFECYEWKLGRLELSEFRIKALACTCIQLFL